MKNTEEKTIMYDSPEACKAITLDGFSSAGGFFFRKEEDARMSGCTHRLCDCGQIMEKFRTMCENCSVKKKRDKYATLPFKEWDGVTPLTLYMDDKYFFSEDDITEYLYENEIKPEDLQLMYCQPNHYPEIDYYEMISDILPEDSDGNFPKILEDKLKEVNAIIKTMPPCSWEEGKVRTTYMLKSE